MILGNIVKLRRLSRAWRIAREILDATLFGPFVTEGPDEAEAAKMLLTIGAAKVRPEIGFLRDSGRWDVVGQPDGFSRGWKLLNRSFPIGNPWIPKQ